MATKIHYHRWDAHKRCTDCGLYRVWKAAYRREKTPPCPASYLEFMEAERKRIILLIYRLQETEAIRLRVKLGWYVTGVR